MAFYNGGSYHAGYNGGLFFADHTPELSKLVLAGRKKELSQFPSIATPEMQASLVDPTAESTFRRSKIDLDELKQPYHGHIYQLHKDVLRLRRVRTSYAGALKGLYEPTSEYLEGERYGWKPG